MTNFALGQQIEKPINGGRRLAIADIHGCFYTLQALVKKIQLTTEDHLFILGDMINRGKRSGYVIDFILHLQASGYSVFPLRGNHENFLHNLLHQKKNASKDDIASSNIFPHLDGKKIKTRHELFFANLPYYYLSGDDYLMVHAGLNFSGNPLENIDDMLTIRQFEYSPEKVAGRKIVHGHTPTDINIITTKIAQRSPVIDLDNGCVFREKRPERGQLLCMDLDSFELVIQRNIE